MTRSKKPRHRLSINVTVNSGASSSTSRINTSALSDAEPVVITFKMQPRAIMVDDGTDDAEKGVDLGEEAAGTNSDGPLDVHPDTDQTNLMQMPRNPTPGSMDSGIIARVRQLLAATHPQLRSDILRALKARLDQRLRQLLRQVNGRMEVLQQGILGEDTCVNNTAIASISDIVTFIVNQIEQHMTVPVEEHLLSLDELIVAFHSLTTSPSVDSQSAASSSSWQLPPAPGSAAEVLEVAELPRNGIASDLMALEAEDQEQSCRELVVRMMEETQNLGVGAQLRTMLLLLPEFLPQR